MHSRVTSVAGGGDFEIWKMDAVNGDLSFLQQLTVNTDVDRDPDWGEVKP